MRRKDGESGQSMIEFALVLPVLALFLLGIIDFGRIMSANLTVADAARDAARHASIGETDSELQQVVASDTASLGNSVVYSIQPSGQRNSGDTATVTVSYDVSVLDPLMAAIIGGKFTVSSHVAMRVE